MNPLAWSERFTISTDEVRQRLGHGSRRTWSLIARDRRQLHQEWIQSKQGQKQQNAAVTVLDVRGMDFGVQQQAYRIDQDMPLDPLDLLART